MMRTIYDLLIWEYTSKNEKLIVLFITFKIICNFIDFYFSIMKSTFLGYVKIKIQNNDSINNYFEIINFSFISNIIFTVQFLNFKSYFYKFNCEK